MRIRQIKPAWFTDKALQTGLKADAREFYVGLWMLADDDGWFEWDIDVIGVAIYGFQAYSRRAVLIERHSQALLLLTPETPHLIIHPCGHAQVPKMPQHQRVSEAKRVTTDHRRHTEGKCPLPAASRGAPRMPAPPPPGKELVGNGNGNGSARKREDDGVRFPPFAEVVKPEASRDEGDPDAMDTDYIGGAS